MSRDDHMKTRTTFNELVHGREAEFPLLARAAANTMGAVSPKIEWLVYAEDNEYLTDFNYQQVVRADSSTALLGEVEKILTYGVRDFDASIPLAYCGGASDLLGREVRDDDVLTLRPLREPFQWDTGEWFAEVSLMAQSADVARAMREREEALVA